MLNESFSVIFKHRDVIHYDIAIYDNLFQRCLFAQLISTTKNQSIFQGYVNDFLGTKDC